MFTSVTWEYASERSVPFKVRLPGVYVSAYWIRTATLFETSETVGDNRVCLGDSLDVAGDVVVEGRDEGE